MTRLARNAGGRIANTLRGLILTGSIDQRACRHETKFAARCGGSRGPVRDALLVLSKEGFVVPRSRGCTVADAAPRSIEAFVVPIRRTLECYALELVFDSLMEECFQTWDEILVTFRRACVARDETMIVEQDIALHRSIVEMSGQPDLVAIWTTIVARIRRYFSEGCRRYADPMEQYEEQVELIRVFRERDKALAVKALEEHVK